MGAIYGTSGKVWPLSGGLKLYATVVVNHCHKIVCERSRRSTGRDDTVVVTDQSDCAESRFAPPDEPERTGPSESPTGSGNDRPMDAEPGPPNPASPLPHLANPAMDSGQLDCPEPVHTRA